MLLSDGRPNTVTPIYPLFFKEGIMNQPNYILTIQPFNSPSQLAVLQSARVNKPLRTNGQSLCVDMQAG